MSLPHGVVGWSAVCDYDISCSYQLFEARTVLTNGRIIASIFNKFHLMIWLHLIIPKIKES